jgi:hypothetical protein
MRNTNAGESDETFASFKKTASKPSEVSLAIISHRSRGTNPAVDFGISTMDVDSRTPSPLAGEGWGEGERAL